MSASNVVAMIPARYEAVRFPGKLLADLAGKPVIIRTLEATVQTGLFEEVYVVTDSEQIEQVVTGYGGKCIKSKQVHQTGSDRIAEAATQVDADIIINVQGDEPFVNKKSLKKLIQTFENDTSINIDIATLAFPITNSQDIENPNNVKVVFDENYMALYFSRSPIPFEAGEKATYYQHIGVYAFKKEALVQFAKLPMSNLEKIEKLENLRFLENGMKVKLVPVAEMSVGIDTPDDLAKAIQVFKEKTS